MKRSMAIALLLGLLTCAGCFTTAPTDTPPVIAMKTPVAPKAPPPVTADRVTPTNGHQIAQALQEELDYEVRWATTPTSTPTPMPAPTAKTK